ncbi:MAG: ribonuclease J [Dehalococcoidia bacterium]|nr:MAG: ribonuclease J [Dehalococcoidia bacterium]
MAKSRLKIIPLGGLGEIGKNMMVIECDNDIIIVDVGLMFPDIEMMGVDLVIPDISYLEDQRDRIRGIIITHGHQDHIGALPYLLPVLNAPVYATRLTMGLIEGELKEQKVRDRVVLKVLPSDGVVTLGKFRVEFFPVNHSIPDAVGLIIDTPLGKIVHTGDFKLDHTPVSGKPTDFSRLACLGVKGVLLLLSDSTYAELPGYTPSESVVGENLERVIAAAPGRVIVATFSSLVSRIQQVIDAAVKHQRRVFIVGRSMTNTVRISQELGYLRAPDGVLGQLDELKGLPADKIVFVTTGSQGEPTSALVRIANRDFRQLHIVPGDTVVISASPIPGNEALIHRVINDIFKQGAQVLYSGLAQPAVHVHGHASQEELKLILSLTKPRFFVPVHGEYRHLVQHARLAEQVGVARENIFVMQDGDILELGPRHGRVTGRANAGNVYVDGLSVGDIGSVVLRDRKMLSRDGIVMVIIAINGQTGELVGRPDIISRGFVESKDLDVIEHSRDLVSEVLTHRRNRLAEWSVIDNKVRETLNRFYYEQTRRRPMILPFMMKV